MKKRVIVCGLLLCLSTAILVFLAWEDNKSQDIYEQLKEIQNSGYVVEVGLEDEEEAKENISFVNFQELYELNNHFLGWITIEETEIDYPVMQYKEVKDYYLYRDFYGNYSSYGVPYVDELCDMKLSNNIIIYGHAMKNGTMFADLLKYSSYEYYSEHSKIIYDDETGFYEYEIFSVFPIDLSKDQFAYTSYVNMSQKKFDEFIQNIKAREYYDTNIIPEYGQQLMTLSTCESSYDDGRLVIVAVRK